GARVDVYPVINAEPLGSHRRFDPGCFKDFKDVIARQAEAVDEVIQQLLARLREPATHDVEEVLVLTLGYRQLVAGDDPDDRRLHLGWWHERAGPDAEEELRYPVELHADRQQVHVRRPGDNPLGNLALQH